MAEKNKEVKSEVKDEIKVKPEVKKESKPEVKKEIKKPKFQLDKVITLGNGLVITPEMMSDKIEKYIKINFPEVYAKFTK